MHHPATHKAWILLLTFVVGGVVAPLSHYLYMEVAVAMTAVPGEDAHAGHHGHGATAHGALPIDGSETWRGAVDPHEFCDYADLFATFAATGPATVGLGYHLNIVPAPTPIEPGAPSAVAPASLHLRGPPTA